MPPSLPPLPPTTFRPPPLEGTPPPVPARQRFGAIVGAGVLAAAFMSLPASLRVGAAPGSGGALPAWLSLVACAVVPATLGVALLRAAREGLRAFAGPDAMLHLLGAVTWAVCLFGAMTALGAGLRATTHHHGLAGVTFALAALVAAVAIGLVVRRVVVLAQRSSPRARAVLVGLTMAALAAVVAAVAIGGVGLTRAAPAGTSGALPPSTGAMFVDLLAFAIATGFLSRAEFARRHLLARLGLPVGGGLFTLGVLLLVRSSPLADAIVERAPAFAPLVAVVTGR
jgi:hypothetical protein